MILLVSVSFPLLTTLYDTVLVSVSFPLLSTCYGTAGERIVPSPGQHVMILLVSGPVVQSRLSTISTRYDTTGEQIVPSPDNM